MIWSLSGLEYLARWCEVVSPALSNVEVAEVAADVGYLSSLFILDVRQRRVSLDVVALLGIQSPCLAVGVSP